VPISSIISFGAFSRVFVSAAPTPNRTYGRTVLGR
jgi:hypothetical protein